jgi:hypothetical protein
MNLANRSVTIMSKKMKTPSSGARKRRKHLSHASVALTAVMTAGIVLAPNGADAALTTGPDKAPYEASVTADSSIALRDVLRDHPKSEMAKEAFVQLAALCGGDSSAGRDPDCTGSIAADAASDPPSGEQSNPGRIY